VIKITEEPLPEKDTLDTPEERAEVGPPPGLGWTGPDGTWSTWRERHITILAYFRELIRGLSPDIPDEWKDEIQYYYTGWALAKVTQGAILIFLLENHREVLALLGI
jgi:hypothetical protein